MNHGEHGGHGGNSEIPLNALIAIERIELTLTVLPVLPASPWFNVLWFTLACHDGRPRIYLQKGHLLQRGFIMIGNLTRVTFGLFLACCLSPVVAQDKKDVVNPRHIPGGGVADPAGKVGFFPNTSGGIDAIDLATGKTLWTSTSANRPLLATADKVFAQYKANIVVIDATNGKSIRTSDAVAWPDWVAVEPAHGRTFRSDARLEGNALYLTWDARAFYAGGARPTPEIEKRARKESTGVAKLDIDNGKLELLD